MSQTIAEAAKQSAAFLQGHFFPKVEGEYRQDLYQIFLKQEQLTIYPNGASTAFNFAGKDYINPGYGNLYDNDIVLRSRSLHPSLVCDMHSLLAKYELFLRVKNKLSAYCIRWFSEWWKMNHKPDQAYVITFSFPDETRRAWFSSHGDYLNLTKDFPLFAQKWYSREKEEHEFYRTLYLKQQLLRK